MKKLVQNFNFIKLNSFSIISFFEQNINQIKSKSKFFLMNLF